VPDVCERFHLTLKGGADSPPTVPTRHLASVGCGALTRAKNMSRVNSFRARLIRTLCCCFVVHNIFLRNGQELPAFGHSNTRTVQEAPVFSLVRQWHPACVNTTEQRSAAPRLPDGDRRYSRPPRCFCGRLAQLSASAAATFELGRERIATRLPTSN
jgi:hypothetical protein